MTDETVNAGISAKVVETDEAPFIPPISATITADLDPENEGQVVDTAAAAKSIFVELEPEQQDQSTFYSPDWLEFYNSYIKSPTTSYKTLPAYEAEPKELVINIETTGALPWENRLILISALDPNKAEPEILTFLQESEEATIKEFVDWFNNSTYSTLVSYNVGFDYRFLYTLMQRYRIACPEWPDLYLYDCMTQQKQVKQAYVPGYNKEGTLEQWSTYLFGTQPYAPQSKVYDWLKEGNLDEIVAFNEDKVTKTYFLFSMHKLVAGTILPLEGGAGSEEASAQTKAGVELEQITGTGKEIEVYCSNCGQRQYMPVEQKSTVCSVCDTPIANPNI